MEQGQVEEWRPVPGYEGLYEVSSLGRIRSLYRGGRYLSTKGTDESGYAVVSLTRGGCRHTYTLHRLVCRAFRGEPNVLHREAAHLDGDKTNCCASNLKWVSRAENEYHKRFHGTHQAGRGSAKLSETDIPVIRERGRAGEGATAIARDYPVSHHGIQKILNGRNWRHVQ
jgi:hypothetical protein